MKFTQVFVVAGSQGWGNALNPAFSPVLYSTYAAAGARFTTLAPTTIARMYHSTANLMQVRIFFLVFGLNLHIHKSIHCVADHVPRN